MEEFIEDGYIKLSRRIFNSKTFSSLNAIQKLITIYLILMANHKDNQWWDNHEKKFITIKRGSFITSIDNIKKKIKDRLITTQKIRTLLETLKNMRFLTIETTSRYSLVTINKYNLYQNGDSYINKLSNKAVTKQQQSGNKAVTTNKNGKKGKNGNNGKNLEKDIKESEDSFPSKSKTKDNDPLEFSFEDKCWWGLYDWRIKMYQGAFPMLTVNYLFNDKWKTKFLADPVKYKKMIKEKYEDDIAKLVWAWLQQAKKFYIRDHKEKG